MEDTILKGVGCTIAASRTHQQERVFDYDGCPVTFSTGENVMVNATEMAKSFGKKPLEWLSNNQTKELIASLSAKVGIPTLELVKVQKGGNHSGTWLHEDLALVFAQWLSPRFYLWCNDRIKELMQFGMTATQPTIDQLLDNPDLIIDMATRLKAERQKRADAERQIETMSNEIIELRKKTDYLEVILESKETVTTTQIAQDYGMSAKAFNRLLADMRIQRKVNGQWILYAPYVSKGYVHSKTTSITHTDGTRDTVLNTEWRQKGRIFLYEKLKAKGILPLIEQN